MIVPLISKQFKMTAEVTTELLVQLSAYFVHTGIHDEEYVSFMTNYVDWTPPQTIATPKQKMSLISISITLLLSKIASYTVALQEEKLYLSPGIRYCALTTWFAKYNKISTEILTNLARLLVQTLRIRRQKSLRLKCLFLEEIHLTGKNTSRWLKQPSYRVQCRNFWKTQTTATIHHSGQGIFASRLRKSIEESDILSFLTTELDSENNCTRVWT